MGPSMSYVAFKQAIVEKPEMFDEFDLPENVKKALRAGLEETTADFDIQINLIAPPAYKIETTALDRQSGAEALNRCIATIRRELESRHGELEVTVEPQAVNEDDDKAMKERIDGIERDMMTDDEEDEMDNDIE